MEGRKISVLNEIDGSSALANRLPSRLYVGSRLCLEMETGGNKIYYAKKESSFCNAVNAVSELL